MPAKPQEREYRMMAMPLTVFDDVEDGEDGEQRYANRFNSARYAEGYATTFNDPYVLWQEPDWVDERGETQKGWTYVEVIDRHALDEADMSDVVFLCDHEGTVYARNHSGTLYIEPNDHGLFTAVDFSRTSDAGRMFEHIQAGDYYQMSWAFTVEEEDVEDDEANRVSTITVRKVRKVYDVSCVSRPADPNTEISARRVIDGAIEARKLREAQQAEREMERRRRELALRAKAMGFN